MMNKSMHAGQQTDMKRGAIWACAIPIGLGVLGLVFCVFSFRNPWAVIGAGYFQSDFWVFLPILACFIFGAPLSAWLACRSLRKIKSVEKLSKWRSSAFRGLLSASLVHVVSATLYTLGFFVIILGETADLFPDQDDRIGTLAGICVGSAISNLMLWIIITLPLSLICATIFWKVTKFPEDTSVF